MAEPGTEPNPIVGRRKLIQHGGSIVIAVPPEWLKQNGFEVGDDVTLIANRDVKLLSPETLKKYYGQLTEIVAKEE